MNSNAYNFLDEAAQTALLFDIYYLYPLFHQAFLFFHFSQVVIINLAVYHFL
jgi:hypothetical protein